MWVRRALVDYFVEVEEPGIGDPLLSEGLQAIAPVIGEEPACAEGDGAWCCGDLAGRVLFESCVKFGGRDEVGGEGVGASRGDFEERMVALCSVEGRIASSSEQEGSCRHGVLSYWSLSVAHEKSGLEVVTMFCWLSEAGGNREELKKQKKGSSGKRGVGDPRM